MKKLDLNGYLVQTLTKNESNEICGGDKFQVKEAAVAFLLMSAAGVGVYWYFCD